MSKIKPISGKDCIKILCNEFGFYPVRQRGSHVILRKDSNGNSFGTSVPNHKELKIGMLKIILKHAKISEEEFSKYL